jgi:hypothetical protein
MSPYVLLYVYVFALLLILRIYTIYSRDSLEIFVCLNFVCLVVRAFFQCVFLVVVGSIVFYFYIRLFIFPSRFPPHSICVPNSPSPPPAISFFNWFVLLLECNKVQFLPSMLTICHPVLPSHIPSSHTPIVICVLIMFIFSLGLIDIDKTFQKTNQKSIRFCGKSNYISWPNETKYSHTSSTHRQAEKIN